MRSFQHVNPGHVGQFIIQQEDGRRLFPERRQGFFAGGGGPYGEGYRFPEIRQGNGEAFQRALGAAAHAGFVVNYKDVELVGPEVVVRHGFHPRPSGASTRL